jgi:excisionase family DNA binding protein
MLPDTTPTPRKTMTDSTTHPEILETLIARIDALEAMVARGSSAIDPDMLYTANEAADRLRCSPANVYALLETGELAVTRTGAGRKGLKVKGASIVAFLEERTEGGPAPRMRFKHLRSLN